jgi:signal peptidase
VSGRRPRIDKIDDAGPSTAGEHGSVPTPAPAPNLQAGSATVHTLRRLVSWLLGLVLLAGTGAALGVAVYPVVTGGSALAVLSGSMQPGMPVGAMAFIRPVDAATIEVGDVITFQRRPDALELVTHRVIAVDDASGSPVFTTQGDANDAADLDPVPAAAVRGRLWFSVAELGRLAAVLHSPKGVGVLVVLVCAAIGVSPGSRPEKVPVSEPADDIDAGEAHPVAIPGPVGATLTDATVRIALARPPAPRQPTPADGPPWPTSA